MRTTLGDISEVVGGGTPSTSNPAYWGGDVAWITPTEVVARAGAAITETERTLTAAGLAACGATLLPVGTVLLTSRATVGAVAMAGAPMATNQGFASLIAGDRVLASFLMIWVEANRHEFTMRARGSTFPEISRANVAAIPIALPPIDEQKRIVDLVGATDAYCAALAQSEEAHVDLRRALLHQHFSGSGDDGDQTVPLGDLITLKRGFDLPAARREPGAIPVVSSAGVTGWHSASKVDGPAVVIGRYGTLGQVHFVEEPCWPLNTTLFVERFGDLSPHYVACLLETLDLRGHGEKSAVPGVNRNTLHAIPVTITRSSERRTEFLASISAIDGSLEAVRGAASHARALRRALLHDLISGKHAIPPTYDRRLATA